MHRAWEPPDRPLSPRPPLGATALALLALALVARDTLPLLDAASTWPRDWLGVRFALVAAAVGCARALSNALSRLSEGRVGADLAVALACVAAVLLGEPLVAAEVVTINLAGECVEAWALWRVGHALGALHDLFPVRCWVLREGVEVRTLTADVIVGDRVVVKPGGKIPVDGVVCGGSAAVVTAALTGESLPRAAGVGDAVFAGSIVADGTLTVEATATGADSVAGRVAAETALALRNPGPGERLADRLARYFLPAVLALAATTFLVHHALGRRGSAAAYPALAVLVVACPCPLVLATPAVLLAVLARLAGTGVVLRGGEALERLAAVTSVAFDKTGTLTAGKLELGTLIPAEGVEPEELLRLAASAEAQSGHPIARAVVEAARAIGLETLPLAEAEAHPGLGVVATTAHGTRLVVGSPRLLAEQGVATGAGEAWLSRLDAAGESAWLVARDGELIGAVGTRDALRPEAAGVVAELRQLGLAPVVVLSGDRPAAVRAIAGNLPGVELVGGLLPAEKAARLPDGALYVGDGLNDAPALARAAVGVAVGGMAAGFGRVVLLGEPLTPLPMLVRLARHAVRVMRQNVVGFGFGLNLVGVALTAWLWPGEPEHAPLAAAAFHQLGSLAVLANSLRILGFERIRMPAFKLFDGRTWDALAHDFGHALARRAKPLAGLAALLIAAAWALSGFAIIGPAEAAVVKRFGAVVAELPPGPHLRYPWPAEELTVYRPGETHAVEIGFRRIPADRLAVLKPLAAEQARLRGDASARQDWPAAHGDDAAPLAAESLLMAGDGNLVELRATVRYRVTDAQSYFAAAREPEALVRAAAESALRERVAAADSTHLLTDGRGGLERGAIRLLNARLPTGLGLTVDGLTVHDLHPPREVVAAYHAVAAAAQRRDRGVNDAHAEAARVGQRAEEAAQALRRDGTANALATVQNATAEADAFAAWLGTLAAVGPEVEGRLQAERSARLAAGESPTTIERELTLKREQHLAELRRLTEFRLALDAVTQVLRGRDKVLFDADAPPGRRQFLLLDPGKLPGAAVPATRGRE